MENTEQKDYHTLALEAYHSGDYPRTIHYALSGLKTVPNNADLLCDCGSAYFMLGDYEKAESYYRNAWTLVPNSEMVNINLLNVDFACKRYAAAITKANQILKTNPDSIDTLLILGAVYFEQGRYEDSKRYLERVLNLNPDVFWALNYMEQCSEKTGDYDKALDYGFRAVKASGGEDSQHINYAYALYEIGTAAGMEKVMPYAEQWLDSFPENPIVKYAVAALKNDVSAKISDASYIQKVFDYFADSFEESLRNLEYRVPEYINAFLKRFYGWKIFRNLEILDLGCGTGLVGEYLAGYVGKGHIYGVDLSAGMLKKAQQKNIYSKLFCGDILHFLNDKISCLDLITAADVFIYFGNLDSLFAKMNQALKKGGRAIFSISQNRINERDYFLHASGRFVHSWGYITHILQRNGFRLEKVKEEILRYENGEPVFGWIISVRKI